MFPNSFQKQLFCIISSFSFHILSWTTRVPVTTLCILFENLPNQTHEHNKYPLYVPQHTGDINHKLCTTMYVESPLSPENSFSNVIQAIFHNLF